MFALGHWRTLESGLGMSALLPRADIAVPSDYQLDVRVVLVPKLDGIREVELVPCSHKGIGERNGNIV